MVASISSLEVFNKLIVILRPCLWDKCPSKGIICETPESENVKTDPVECYADPVECYVLQECFRHALICSISCMTEQVVLLIS